MKPLRTPHLLAIIILTAAAYFSSWILLDAILNALGNKLYASAIIFYSPALALWFIALTASLLALQRASSSTHPTFWPAAIFSTLAIGVSATGLTRIHIVSTQTVNGQLRRGIESWWFFTATLLLGLLALAWSHCKSRPSPL
jgi:hypothetical protein